MPPKRVVRAVRTISTRSRPADPEDASTIQANLGENLRLGTQEPFVGPSTSASTGRQVRSRIQMNTPHNEPDNPVNQIQLNEMKNDIGTLKEQVAHLVNLVSHQPSAELVQSLCRVVDSLRAEHSLSQGVNTCQVGPSVLHDNAIPTPSDPRVTSHNPPKPTKYDGSISWEEYKTQFSIIAQANRWDDREMGEHLVASLSGAPLTVVHNLPRIHQASFQKLSEAFQVRFGSEHLTTLLHTQLQSRKQCHGETLAELATDIERLARGAFPDCPINAVERIAIRSFIHGIRDVNVRLAVSISAPTTLQKALLTAQVHEVDSITQVNEAEGLPKPAKEPLKCYECRGVGHFRRECPKRPQKEN